MAKKWFNYRQNNSGGFFSDPAEVVCIKASNVDRANKIALALGVYFDGCSKGMDCSCCGDRWCQPWDSDDKPCELLPYRPEDNRRIRVKDTKNGFKVKFDNMDVKQMASVFNALEIME